MPPEAPLLKVVLAALRDRLAAARASREAGYSTETVLMVAALAALALAVVAIITAKVLAKARSIDLG